jgi:hypothetical protein
LRARGLPARRGGAALERGKAENELHKGACVRACGSGFRGGWCGGWGTHLSGETGRAPLQSTRPGGRPPEPQSVQHTDARIDAAAAGLSPASCGRRAPPHLKPQRHKPPKGSAHACRPCRAAEPSVRGGVGEGISLNSSGRWARTLCPCVPPSPAGQPLKHSWHGAAPRPVLGSGCVGEDQL